AAKPTDCPRCGAPLPALKGGQTVCRYCRNTINLELPVRRDPTRRTTLNLVRWMKAELMWPAIVLLAVGGWQAQRFVAGTVASTTPLSTSSVTSASAAP